MSGGHGRDPRRMQFVVTTDRIDYAKFMQKVNRLGLKRNDVIQTLIREYAGDEDLDAKGKAWVKESIQADLDKRGWTWDRIGKPRGPSKNKKASTKVS